jgi:DNA mismatch repair ATPase MutS
MAVNEKTDSRLKALEDPEVMASLEYILRQMPDIEKSLRKVQEGAAFAGAVLQDEAAVQSMEERVSSYRVDPEALAAAVRLANKLPEMEAALTQAENVLLFVQDISRDEASMESLKKSSEKYAEPWIQQGKAHLSTIEEIKRRAENDKKSYSLLHLLKWRRRKPVQTVLRYINASLDVMEQKK